MFLEDRKYGRLKRLGTKILESLKKKQEDEEERKRRKEEKKLEAQKRSQRLLGYMDLEAELGSDNENNDDEIKDIDVENIILFEDFRKMRMENMKMALIKIWQNSLTMDSKMMSELYIIVIKG